MKTDNTELIIVPAKSTVKPKKHVVGSEHSINYLFGFCFVFICIALGTWSWFALKYCIMQTTH